MTIDNEIARLDLKPGDVVWIKFAVKSHPDRYGDTLLQYLPRPGVDATAARQLPGEHIRYAQRKVNDAFIRPDMFNWARRLYNRLKPYLRSQRHC